jgi:hypothetical protein
MGGKAMKDHSERNVFIVMLWTAILLAWVLMCVMGCAYNMTYTYAPGATHQDFERQKIELG